MWWALLFVVGTHAINCSLSFDESLPMQQQLQLENILVPFDIDPPFSYIGDDGRVAGFSVDVLQEVANRGNFSVTVSSAGQAQVNETNEDVLARLGDNYDFFGSYWTDLPTRRATGAMFSLHYVDATRYLITLPDQPKPPALTDNMFSFLDPFTGVLWIVIIFGICFSGAVTYWFEMSSICGRKHHLEEALESNGKRWKVYWSYIHRSFAHFTMSGDGLQAKSVMGKVHNIVWAFVVLVLLSAYTANLASTLVVKKQKFISYPNVEVVLANDQVLCTSANDATLGSLLANYPGLRTYHPPHDPAFSYDQELADALLAGHCVGAIMKSTSYQILRTNVSYCQLNQRAQFGPTVGAGFGFPIERCGAFYLAVVNSILATMQADHTLDRLWTKQVHQVNCPTIVTQTVVASAQGLGLDSFAGLFILYLCWIGCTVFLRVSRKFFTCVDRTAEKIKVKVSKSKNSANSDTEVENSEIETEKSGDVDVDAIYSKVAGVEHTMESIMLALRALNYKPGDTMPSEKKDEPPTHTRHDSKGVHAPVHIRTSSKDTLTHKRTESKQSSTPKNSPDTNTKRLSQTTQSPAGNTKRLSQNTPAAPAETKANNTANSTKRLSQNLTPVVAPAVEPKPNPEKRLSQNTPVEVPTEQSKPITPTTATTTTAATTTAATSATSAPLGTSATTTTTTATAAATSTPPKSAPPPPPQPTPAEAETPSATQPEPTQAEPAKVTVKGLSFTPMEVVTSEVEPPKASPHQVGRLTQAAYAPFGTASSPRQSSPSQSAASGDSQEPTKRESRSSSNTSPKLESVTEEESETKSAASTTDAKQEIVATQETRSSTSAIKQESRASTSAPKQESPEYRPSSSTPKLELPAPPEDDAAPTEAQSQGEGKVAEQELPASTAATESQPIPEPVATEAQPSTELEATEPKRVSESESVAQEQAN